MFDELDREVFATGELIFRVGDAGECAYVIEEGSVEVYIVQSGAEQLLVPCPANIFGRDTPNSRSCRVRSGTRFE